MGTAQELPNVLRNVELLAAKFASAHVVLVENDSIDKTVKVFTTWARCFVSRGSLNDTAAATAGCHNKTSQHGRFAELIRFHAKTAYKKDLETLAVARNHYLDLLDQPRHADVDYLIVVDTDMCAPWDVDRMIKVST